MILPDDPHVGMVPTKGTDVLRLFEKRCADRSWPFFADATLARGLHPSHRLPRQHGRLPFLRLLLLQAHEIVRGGAFPLLRSEHRGDEDAGLQLWPAAPQSNSRQHVRSVPPFTSTNTLLTFRFIRMVCLATYLAMGSRDAMGKAFNLVFPPYIFVICGFEHVVANMVSISPCGVVRRTDGANDPPDTCSTLSTSASSTTRSRQFLICSVSLPYSLCCLDLPDRRASSDSQ